MFTGTFTIKVKMRFTAHDKKSLKEAVSEAKKNSTNTSCGGFFWRYEPIKKSARLTSINWQTHGMRAHTTRRTRNAHHA